MVFCKKKRNHALVTEVKTLTDLSPAAQAVLDAYENSPQTGFCLGEQKALAAALRALADQVCHEWDGMECVDHLVAIAAELESADA